jgi:hypothetical protein
MNEASKGKAMKNSLTVWIQRALDFLPGSLRALGPYLLVELILPGGSLLALLLWLYNHRPART